jgi:nucleoside-diphosphate-sugar epimerase
MSEAKLGKFFLPARAANANSAVLVVGGAGYIGSVLVSQLLLSGRSVRVLDNCMYGRESMAGVLGHQQCEIVIADCGNAKAIVPALQGIDTVVYLAGVVGDAACQHNPENTYEVNCTAPRMLARLAKANGVRRFVLASSCSVYGATEETVTEESAVNPVSLYARSKLHSEAELLAEGDPGFVTVVLRFATAFGDSSRPRFDLAVNLLTAHAYHNGEITIFNGSSWRPFIHVQDVAKAVMMAIDSPANLVAGQIFNVGDSRLNYTFYGVADILCARFPSVKVINGHDLDRRNYRVSFDKIANVLGFRSSNSLEYGIEEVRRGLEQGRPADYRDSRYNNLKFLTTRKSPPRAEELAEAAGPEALAGEAKAAAPRY